MKICLPLKNENARKLLSLPYPSRRNHQCNTHDYRPDYETHSYYGGGVYNIPSHGGNYTANLEKRVPQIRTAPGFPLFRNNPQVQRS